MIARWGNICRDTIQQRRRATVAIAGIAILLIWLITAVLGIASFGFWIWMLIDCITKEPSEGNDKLIWILVIVFTNFVGAPLYYFVRRPERIQNFCQ